MEGPAAYNTLLGLAEVDLHAAWDRFQGDKRIPWKSMAGQVPRERLKVWVDALKKKVEHFEKIERLHS